MRHRNFYLKNIIIVLVALFIMPLNYSFQNIIAIDSTPVSNTVSQITKDSNYKISVDEETGRFEIVNSTTGASWESNKINWREDTTAKDIWKSSLNSQLIVEYMTKDGKVSDKTTSYRGSMKNGDAKIEKYENGFKIVYTFPDLKLVIPLEIRLIGDYLEAKINVKDIKNSGIYEILSISVLPFFGASNISDKGFIFVPSGSGGIINFNSGKYTAGDYLTTIYGKDNSTESNEYFNTGEPSRIPVFGISKNQHSFLGVIEKGDAISGLTASISGANTDMNSVFPSFYIKSTDKVYIKDFSNKEREFSILDNMKQDMGELVVRYYLLDNLNMYNDMALRYKKYLMEEKNMKIKSPQYSLNLSIYGAALKNKLFMGFEVERPEVFSTLSQLENSIKELNSKGIYDISVNLKKFNEDSVYNKRLKSAKILSALGNNTQLERISKAVGNGKVFMTVDPMQANSKGIFNSSANKSARKITNLSVKLNKYNLENNIIEEEKSNYLLSPEYVEENIINISKKSSIVNISFDTIGEILYSDFGKKEQNRIESSQKISNGLDKFEKEKNTVMVSGANAYLFPSVSDISNIPVDSGKNVLIDYSVPFMQLALSGLIDFSGPSINLSANPHYQFLKSIESGSSLQFSYIYNDTSFLRKTELSWLCGTEYSMWKDDMEKYQKSFKQMTDATQNSVMAYHRVIDNGVTETTYSNRVKIIVNYNQTPFTYETKKVDSLSYLIYKE